MTTRSGLKINNVHVFGFQPALHGMRNPAESWNKADSEFYNGPSRWWGAYPGDVLYRYNVPEQPQLGPNDLDRALKLIRGGSEHRKFLRQIIVWFDITLPIYAWSEYDTYKIATVRDSCSTMHKLGTRPLTEKDFAFDDVLPPVLEDLNDLGQRYRDSKKSDFELVCIMKRRLPSGYLQMATFMQSYEVCLNMYFQRQNHRLAEWRDTNEAGVMSVTRFLRSLPYMERFIEAALVPNKVVP